VARARLDEAAFLARRFEPAMAAFSPLDRATGAAVVTTLEAPDGSVLGSLGHAWNAGGGGGSTPQPADARPLLGPTVLDFSFQGGGLDGRAQPPLRIHLDCQAPSRSAGVADTVTACGTIMRRRYDLLAYALFEHSCVPLTNAPSVTIRGTLGGYPVRRDDDPCYVGDASARLAGVLGVPPTGWQPVSSGVLRAAIPPAWHAAALGGQAWLQLTTVRPAASRWDPTSSLRGGDVVVTVAPASGGGKALPAVVPLSAAQQVVGAGAPAGRTRYREEVDLGAGVVEIEVDVLAEPPALETLDTVDRILQTIQPTAGFGPAPTAGGRPVVLR
jgi:hypothetical protein